MALRLSRHRLPFWLPFSDARAKMPMLASSSQNSWQLRQANSENATSLKDGYPQLPFQPCGHSRFKDPMRGLLHGGPLEISQRKNTFTTKWEQLPMVHGDFGGERNIDQPPCNVEGFLVHSLPCSGISKGATCAAGHVAYGRGGGSRQNGDMVRSIRMLLYLRVSSFLAVWMGKPTNLNLPFCGFPDFET